MAEPLRVALSGEGGQGIQSIAQILAEAAYKDGKEALYIPNFGVEQRGGVSLAFVQIAKKPIGSPKFSKGDIVVALSKRAVARTKQYVNSHTILVYDSSFFSVPEIEDDVVGIQSYDTIAPDAFAERAGEEPEGQRISFRSGAGKIIGIPAAYEAKNNFHPRVFNVIILGAVVELTGILVLESVYNALEDKFGSKFKQDPDLRKLNYRAFERGQQIIREAEKTQADGSGAVKGGEGNDITESGSVSEKHRKG